MLDRTGMPARSGAGLKVCIIGAGISGLVAAKVLRERGHAISLLEKSGDIGGVWEPARSYPGVKTQTPGQMYAYTDLPMPADYPEWPSGAQVHAYLDTYAARANLRACIRFHTEVLQVSQAAERGTWDVTMRTADAPSSVERFDVVVVATGQFSQPRRLVLDGEDRFRAAGGLIRHSSEHGDGAVVRGRDVVIVGFSKSATDIAMNALDEGARSVSLVYREASWKIPYFFGGVVNFKSILYCRAAEALFMPWAPSALGRLLRRLSAPLISANWRALETLLNVQFGLGKIGMRPKERIEDSIHCATSIETPGFYKAIREGRITAVRGALQGCEAGAMLVEGGQRLKADVVVLAIGWEQGLPFLDAPTRDALIAPDGQHRLHRMIVNPDLPGLAFVGFNSSFITTLSAEIGAHWLARFIAGDLARQPDEATMRRSIDNQLSWKRERRKVAMTFGGLCVAPYHHAHFDELMDDMGAPRKQRNWLAAHLAPISPATYGRLLASASPSRINQKERAA